MSNDFHAQTARELFGNDDPAHRRLAKDINFGRMYGGARLLPHQQDLIEKAREMTNRFFPGLRLDTAKTGPLSIVADETSVIVERKPRC